MLDVSALSYRLNETWANKKTGNTYSTALLIGEKCAVLTGEDLGYSGSALDMKVPEYNAPGEMKLALRL